MRFSDYKDFKDFCIKNNFTVAQGLQYLIDEYEKRGII